MDKRTVPKDLGGQKVRHWRDCRFNQTVSLVAPVRCLDSNWKVENWYRTLNESGRWRGESWEQKIVKNSSG